MRSCYCLLPPVSPTTHHLNTLDVAILGNLALILILNLHITDPNTPIGVRQFCASLQMILIYLALLYPNIFLEKKVNLKGRQLRCCQKQEEREDNAEPNAGSTSRDTWELTSNNRTSCWSANLMQRMMILWLRHACLTPLILTVYFPKIAMFSQYTLPKFVHIVL